MGCVNAMKPGRFHELIKQIRKEARCNLCQDCVDTPAKPQTEELSDLCKECQNEVNKLDGQPQFASKIYGVGTPSTTRLQFRGGMSSKRRREIQQALSAMQRGSDPRHKDNPPVVETDGQSHR